MSGEETAGKRGMSGFALLVIGGICMASSFTNLPPKFERLTASEANVTKAPYITHKMKVWDYLNVAEDVVLGHWHKLNLSQYQYPVLDLDGIPTWIGTGAMFAGRPPDLASVHTGDRIRVWIDVPQSQLWQAASGDKTIMAYGDVARRDGERRHTARYLSFALMLFGVVLAFLKV